jgi:hypothetical protein
VPYKDPEVAREYSKAYQRRPAVQAYKARLAARPHEVRKRKNNNLRRYKITVEDFEQMLLEQNGRCANPGCLTTEPGGRGDFSVDHDHATGKVRGLLCLACNCAAGYLRDDPGKMRGLAVYVEDHRAKSS